MVGMVPGEVLLTDFLSLIPLALGLLVTVLRIRAGWGRVVAGVVAGMFLVGMVMPLATSSLLSGGSYSSGLGLLFGVVVEEAVRVVPAVVVGFVLAYFFGASDWLLFLATVASGVGYGVGEFLLMRSQYSAFPMMEFVAYRLPALAGHAVWSLAWASVLPAVINGEEWKKWAPGAVLIIASHYMFNTAVASITRVMPFEVLGALALGVVPLLYLITGGNQHCMSEPRGV
ncbi:hypothetical protein [Pyrococcus kukulkanii]|uniref:hypothetical protein n=1 Tax=Pyrococcus kukulkanii TaxID=1609559 RepID=UPI003567BC67